MGYVTLYYILHSTGFDSSFVLIDYTNVLSAVNDSDEELDDQMLYENFGGIQIKDDYLGQKCFADAKYK